MAYKIKLRVITLIAIQILFLVSIASAQDKSSDIQDRSKDMFQEMNTGELTLRFVNALTGEYVPGASVLINGEEKFSDYEGKVLFKPSVENGQVPVVFEKDGFITARFDLELMVGTIFQNRISVSPDLQPGSIRIVLDWSDNPRDLDAHLIKEGGYHISYRNKKSSDDGKAKLDRDDRNGNGPETITVKQVDQGDVYTYKVLNYSDRRDENSKELSNQSRATIRIYGDNQLLGTYRINDERFGTEWTVFQIKNGRIQPVDTIE